MEEHEDRGDSGSERPDSQDTGTPIGPIDLRPVRAPQLRTPRAAGVAGILFSLLLVASFLLVRFPPIDLGDAETVKWFEDNVTSPLTLTGLYLVPLMGIAMCVMLMAGLPKLTWIGFGLWLVAGLTIYFSYGIRKSRLRQSGSPPPAA